MKRSSFVSLAICLFFSTAFCVIRVFAQTSAENVNDEKFGKLPPNPVSTWELSGVRTEIAVEHFLDPAVFKDKLPQGFRPLTVAQAAQGAQSMTQWLEANPKYSGYYVATLLFSAMDNWVVDGTSIGEGGRAPYAAWWVWVTQLHLWTQSRAGAWVFNWPAGIRIPARGGESSVTIQQLNSLRSSWRIPVRVSGGSA
jgi:hypothetical protein